MAITDIVVPGLRRNHLPEQPLVGGSSAGTTAAWPAWGTTASVTVDDPAALTVARRIVSRQIAAAEKAAARFRSDAELHKLYRAGGRPVTVSPLLAELVAASLAVAMRTDGDIDPTVGAALNAVAAAGRDRSHLPVCGSRPTGGRPAAGWEQVRLEGRKLQVPAGTTLDLSATAKAAVCDMAAARVRERVDAGVLVRLGGNVASAGPAPEQGWKVLIEDRDGDLTTQVHLPAGAALSTSRIAVLPERHRNSRVTHMIDPRTGEIPLPVWRMVSAIGFTCLEASTYSTASLVRGTRARSWLTQLWVPARLITVADDELLSGNWAAHATPPNLP
ncbi:FAD:protein FMN transferase [Kineosporia mesophila]|uniref:FAD:protein FMN transferase n=1 Tax=Kineosporia mesophila TaxID=566012 RepID=A0ABP6ZGH2_9ACTN|nr:FAD:protein FMN transferase [Kineosporia mesophila]MCD5350497.1 FAD:protein FMN transferase [Kineosporia mesophila]